MSALPKHAQARSVIRNDPVTPHGLDDPISPSLLTRVTGVMYVRCESGQGLEPACL